MRNEISNALTVDVEDFLLMPTEVTNEQYAEFVRRWRSG